MAEQHYNNHVRYYVPHHFVFYPLAGIAIGLSAWAASKDVSLTWVWAAVASTLILIVFAAFMMRQHYALTLQNRVVRLELRLRYYILTQKRFETVERQLTLGQIHALRFASDEELLGLIDRAIAEQLSPDALKRSIINWQPDEMRV